MKTEQYQSGQRGRVPNSRFPVLIHRSAVPDGGEEPVRDRCRENGWLNNWFYPGIYEYAHFHSTTHECLGCCSGWMDIVVFGKGGDKIRLNAGDILVMPAGVSHEMVGHSDDVMMTGGYPDGRDWDNVQEEFLSEQDYRAAAKRIMMLPIPSLDPATGAPLQEWVNAPSSVDDGWNDYRDALDASA